MKQFDFRGESFGGWLRLSGGLFLALICPVWMILGASFLQAQPFEQLVEADRNGTLYYVQYPMWWRVGVAAIQSGLWIAVLLMFVLSFVGVWGILSQRRRVLDARERAVYSARSPAEFDLGEDEWDIQILDRRKSTAAHHNDGIAHNIREPSGAD